MNKRKFIKTAIFGTIMSLFTPKILSAREYPKFGYLSVDTCVNYKTKIYDWHVTDMETGTYPKLNEKDFLVLEIDDKRGYIKGYCEGDKLRNRKIIYGRFKLTYHGDNPNYQHFK